MKNLISVLVVLITLFSCSENNKNSEKENQEKWQLVEMTGNTPNSEKTGAEMDWQEFYLLNTDGTFTKSRDRNGDITEVSGTYEYVNSGNETILELTYSSANNLIGTCTADLKEYIQVQSDTTFHNSWAACDGPGLKYEKVN